MGKRTKKAERPNKREGVFQRLLLVSEIPGGALGFQPQVEIIGNKTLTIDGFENILEYEPDHIKLNLGKLSLRVSGNELEIKLMQGKTIVIQGTIIGIEYMN